MEPKILCVTGPTATGKTRLAVALAKKFGGEVVSADSMQIYRGMDVGTAKPTPEETQGVPHHMLDILDPGESYSAARYACDASRCVDDILSRGRLPVVAGGTGLYIDALVYRRRYAAFSGETRQALLKQAEELGAGGMHARLEACDPESANRLHPNDVKRVLRALEVYIETGKTLSQYNRETQADRPRYDACVIALDFRDRRALYERIDRRVDLMVERGLFEEVRRLMDAGLAPGQTAMQAIGYKEAAGAIAGELTREEAIGKIKQETRRYAKRQLSWLRRIPEVNWIVMEEEPDFGRTFCISTQILGDRGII